MQQRLMMAATVHMGEWMDIGVDMRTWVPLVLHVPVWCAALVRMHPPPCPACVMRMCVCGSLPGPPPHPQIDHGVACWLCVCVPVYVPAFGDGFGANCHGLILH